MYTGKIIAEKGIFGRKGPSISSEITDTFYKKDDIVVVEELVEDGVRFWAKVKDEYILAESNGVKFIENSDMTPEPYRNVEGFTPQETSNNQSTEEQKKHEEELRQKEINKRISKSTKKANSENMESLANLFGSEQAYAELDSSFLRIKSSRMFGLPFQFTSWVDQRYAEVSSAFGRNFLTRMVLNAPICTFIPGKPKYLSGASKDEKNTLTTVLLSAASDSFKPLKDAFENESDIEAVQYYDFESDYTVYMNYVNILCRTCAGFLELEGPEFDIDGVSLARYDWRNYRWDANSYTSVVGKFLSSATEPVRKQWSSLISSATSAAASVFLGSNASTVDSEGNLVNGSAGNSTEIALDATEIDDEEGYGTIEDMMREVNIVQFYVDPESGVSENMENSSSSSFIKGLFDTGSNIMKELVYVSGGLGTEAGQALENAISALAEGLGDVVSGVGSVVGASDNPLSRFLGVASNLIKGENFIIPDIYQSSSYSKSYDVTISLKNLYGNRYGYYMEILVPLMHLMALSFPRQTTANTYTSPPLVKMFIPGVFSCNLGLVEGFDVDRNVSNESWTVDGLPNEINVKLHIRDLYADMSLSPATKPLLFIHNSSLVDYLAVSCGLDILRPNIAKKANMVWKTASNAFLNIPSNVANVISEDLGNKLTNLTSQLGLIK